MKNYKDYISEDLDRGFPLSEERYKFFYDTLFNAEDSNDVSRGLIILHNIKKRNYWCFKSEYNTIKNIINALPQRDLTTQTAGYNEPIPTKIEPSTYYKDNTSKIKIKYNDKYYRQIISSYKYPTYNYCVKFLDSLKKKTPDDNGFIEITQKQKNFLNGIVSGQVNQESYPKSF